MVEVEEAGEVEEEEEEEVVEEKEAEVEEEVEEERRRKSLNNFNFGAFIGRFQVTARQAWL